MSPATQTDSFSLTFEPRNLVPPAIDPPTFEHAENNIDGTKINVFLTEDVTNASLSGMEEHFTVDLKEYNYVPNGTLQNTTRTVTSVDYYGGLEVNLQNGTMDDTERDNNGISLEVEVVDG